MCFRTLIALLVFAGGIATAVEANGRDRGRDRAHAGDGDGNWVLIEARDVDLKKEEDRFNIGASKGRFKSIVLVGMNRLIDIKRVTVTTDGEPYVEKRRLMLEQGDKSPVILFSREGSVVRHVDLSYRLHLGAAGPAKVELWALRAAAEQPVARFEPPRSTTAAATSTAQADDETDGAGAVLFGVQDVGTEVDHDVFRLGREYGRFGRVRLRALSNAVGIKEMRVIYSGGEPDVLALNAVVGADERTPWLDLKGDRFIREIHFVYASQSRSKARLEVYGEYAESWFRPGSGTGAFSSANNGWLYLGGQSPLFVSIRRGLGYETDVVSVARNRGFRNLRLDVKNRAITLNQIKVVYSDGSSDTFADRQRVDGGQSFGPVELKSRRPVKQIEISYRSRIFDSQAQGSSYAFVEFWAR